MRKRKKAQSDAVAVAYRQWRAQEVLRLREENRLFRLLKNAGVGLIFR